MLLGLITRGLLSLAVGLGLASAAAAQTVDDRFAQVRARGLGMTLFADHCASCHGRSGHGDGPRLKELSVRPSDLTRLAERNGWLFPATTVTRAIDGADRVHQNGEMPLWGQVFRADPALANEDAVTERLRALTQFLEFIQVRQRRR
jgi:mono/diheme cytochrome c family protein